MPESISILFEEEDEATIIRTWKNKVYSKFGKGGIKNKFLELIKLDMESEDVVSEVLS